MLKILICDPNYSPAVNRVSTLIKIRYWQKRGAKIYILCSSQAKNFYQENLKEVEFFTFSFQWRSKSYWSVPFEYIRANFKALKLLPKVRDQFDIIYSLSSTLDFLFLPWVLKFFDKKIHWFVMVDNVVPKPSERPGNYILKLIPYLAFLVSNQLLKKSNGIFVVTNFLKNYYQKKGIKVFKTGNGYGVRTTIFRGEILAKTPKVDALYCGRLHIAKGIFDLLEVVKDVIKRDKSFTLGMMGNGDQETKNKFYDKIKEYRLENNVVLLGYKTGKEKGSIYRNCKFFIFLSYDEGCPQAVIEAFVANKPVIAYDLPIYYQVFKKYIKNGQIVLFEKKAIKKIAKYILAGKYEKLSFNNKLENFSWDKICQKELDSFLKR